MNFNQGNLTELLKEGTQEHSDNVHLKNIIAVKNLANISRTSMGPNGLNKMVINHLGNLIVTHDASTIVEELEVIHPAAKLVTLAAKAMKSEVGDGTNMVITLASELLLQAEALLRMGLHPADIILGYKTALKHALQCVKETGPALTVTDFTNKNLIVKAMYSAVSAKQKDYVDFLAPIIAEACIICKPSNAQSFSVDNVRVTKIPGGTITDSYVEKGFVLSRNVSGSIKHVKNAKVAVFGINVASSQTEGKGVVEVSNADELFNFAKVEEAEIEAEIAAIAKAGVNVIVSKGAFGELALHYIEKYKMMAIKVVSKFDLRRLCRAIGATPMVRMGAPTQEEVGEASSVDVEEIGSTKCIVFRQENAEDTRVATIVIRGATNNMMDEIERAIDDGVNVYKTLTKDPRLVAGAGAFEAELSRQLVSYSESIEGLEQYSVRKFAESFMIIPKTLAETSGLNSTHVVSKLNAAHQEGKKYWGVDIFDEEGLDATEANLYDSFNTKYWAIKLATDSALNVLSVDAIIMARPAGGPKPRQGGDWDQD
mmetsp:Transcript_7904/g.11723  ORF Transcript_7904/g.11723 Transcript_7904/m.11723 type:complete len:541 (+) Transcript_7904:35-1657(+)